MKQPTGKMTDEQLNEAKRAYESRKNATIQGAALNLAVMLNQGTGDIDSVKEHYEEFQKILRNQHDENMKGSN